MTHWSLRTLFLTLFGCLAAVGGVALICITLGSTGLAWPGTEIRPYRLESVMDAALIGAALASAGVAYQAVLRNPLADPYLLGVSSGASLMAYAWQLPIFSAAIKSLGWAAPLSEESAAFFGALLAIAIVLGLGGRRGRLNPVTLLLIGVIVNAVAGSLYLFISALAREMPGLGGPLTFLVGGLRTIKASQRCSAISIISLGWIVLWWLSGQLNVAGLDDAEAESLGVRIHRTRWIALIAASLMTAAAVAISGPIGFVGLVCPHIGRVIVGPDQRRVLPVATAIGAILLMSADAISRYLSAEQFLGNLIPVGVLTGLLGGPAFLWLLSRSGKSAVGQ